jgi:hypothetical protein|tara:strand:- start:13773 stop:13943 length:171 start_codon:yes stop_codon:yes gene_type:complete
MRDLGESQICPFCGEKTYTLRGFVPQDTSRGEDWWRHCLSCNYEENTDEIPEEKIE